MDPLAHLVVAVGLALLLLSAAVHKLTDFAAFRRILEDYEVMPSWLVATAARVVVVAEIILGTAWLVQFTSVLVVGGTVLLLASYAGAMTLNLMRGRVHISCGCGGSDGQPLSWWMLPRNLLLIVAAMSAIVPVTDRNLGWVDGLLATATLTILLLIYLAVTQLLANAAAIRVWRAV